MKLYQNLHASPIEALSLKARLHDQASGHSGIQLLLACNINLGISLAVYKQQSHRNEVSLGPPRFLSACTHQVEAPLPHAANIILHHQHTEQFSLSLTGYRTHNRSPWWKSGPFNTKSLMKFACSVPEVKAEVSLHRFLACKTSFPG